LLVVARHFRFADPLDQSGHDDAPPGVPDGVDVVGFIADDRAVTGQLPGDG
jgi:hypothetical protein